MTVNPHLEIQVTQDDRIQENPPQKKKILWIITSTILPETGRVKKNSKSGTFWGEQMQLIQLKAANVKTSTQALM